MAEYIVACHLLELPYGHIFTTIPKFPYERDEMVLLSLEGFLIAGRWRPGDGGSDWLELPGLLIELTEQILYRIIGLVIPLDRLNWNSRIIPRASLRGIILQLQPQKGTSPHARAIQILFSLWSAKQSQRPVLPKMWRTI